ncbi:hypothetical protein WAI453_010754 [Rhynchosporium graminicola]
MHGVGWTFQILHFHCDERYQTSTFARTFVAGEMTGDPPSLDATQCDKNIILQYDTKYFQGCQGKGTAGINYQALYAMRPRRYRVELFQRSNFPAG